jgi:hypothetical protein
MTDDRDFTSYVAARWTQLVRSLFALGAPLHHAHESAAVAVSRCHDDWDERDEWGDLDVHVFRELLETWERRRAGWWERPVGPEEAEALADGGWAEVEAVLDRMTVPKRRALVLREVAGLGIDQARALAGVDPGHPDPEVLANLLGVLDLLPVDPPRIEAMIALSKGRRTRRMLVSLSAGLAVLAIAGVVTAVVLRHDDAGNDSSDGFGPVRSEQKFNPSPIAYYADGHLHLARSQVAVPDLREFASWNEGAVYLDLRGNLATVTGDGERALIEALGAEGSFAVSDLEDRVVWIDPDASELVDYDLVSEERVLEVELPSSSRLVLLEGQRAYLTSDEGFFAVELQDGAIHQAVDRRLPGELDRDGRYVLTREGGGAATSRVRLTDTTTGAQVRLDIDDPGHVSAARFAPDGAVILLVEPPTAQISEVRRCEVPFDRCPRIGFYPAGGARAVLAK